MRTPTKRRLEDKAQRTMHWTERGSEKGHREKRARPQPQTPEYERLKSKDSWVTPKAPECGTTGKDRGEAVIPRAHSREGKTRAQTEGKMDRSRDVSKEQPFQNSGGEEWETDSSGQRGTRTKGVCHLRATQVGARLSACQTVWIFSVNHNLKPPLTSEDEHSTSSRKPHWAESGQLRVPPSAW